MEGEKSLNSNFYHDYTMKTHDFPFRNCGIWTVKKKKKEKKLNYF